MKKADQMTDLEKLRLFKSWHEVAERLDETRIAAVTFDRILEIKRALRSKGIRP